MDDEKIIDPRYIEQLRSLPRAPHDDAQDAMAFSILPTAGILGAAAVLLNPKLKEKAHVEIPREPDIFKPTKSALGFLSERDRSETEKYLAKFGEQNGYPVIFVTTLKKFDPPKKDIVHEAIINTEFNIQMFKKSEMHDAVDFARRNGGELGIFNSEIKYIDELNPQPVLDGPLPKFCIAHHCTERGPKCDKCAYTAFSSSHRRRLEV